MSVVMKSRQSCPTSRGYPLMKPFVLRALIEQDDQSWSFPVSAKSGGMHTRQITNSSDQGWSPKTSRGFETAFDNWRAHQSTPARLSIQQAVANDRQNISPTACRGTDPAAASFRASYPERDHDHPAHP